eukprot:jgi/Undpi1/7287/HiC_scaffold_22.g09760.m1
MAEQSEGFFTSTRTFQLKHRTEFRSEADEAWRLSVRQEVTTKIGMALFGKSTLVFDFEPAGSTTATSSPSISARSDAVRKALPRDTATPAAVAAEAVVVEAAGGGGGGAEAAAVMGDGATAGGVIEKEGRGDSEKVTGGVEEAGEVVAEGGGGGDAERTAGASSNSVVLVHNRYNGSKQLYVNQALVYTVEKQCTDGNNNSWVIPMPFGRVALSLTSKLFSHSGFVYKMTFGDVVLYRST